MTSKSIPFQIGHAEWAQVSGSWLHYVAIKIDGSLWGWGENGDGQLGTNNTANKYSPVATISGGNDWKLVAAGNRNTAAIKTDGTLWSWGQNNFGQLGDETNVLYKSSPVQVVGGGTNWKELSFSTHAAAIKTDGTLWSWGQNTFGQLGDETIYDKSSPVQTIAGGTNWKIVSNYGGGATAAIKTDGTLWTWGESGFGENGDGTINSKSSPVQTIAGGTNWSNVYRAFNYTIGIKTDGTLWTWGQNQFGALGDGTTVRKSSPVQVIGGGTNWKQPMSYGGGFELSGAIKTDGTLWMWGYNTYGQLGDGTNVHKSSPVQVYGGGTDWKQVSAGGYLTLAVKNDGTMRAWGNDEYGIYENWDAANLPNRKFDGYTFFGDLGNNWPYVNPTNLPGEYVRGYVAGIFKLEADLTNPAAIADSDIMCGAVFVGTPSGGQGRMVVNGTVVGTVSSNVAVTYINLSMDLIVEFDPSYMQQYTGHCDAFLLDIGTSSASGTSWPPTNVANGRADLLFSTKNVKSAWYVDQVTGAGDGVLVPENPFYHVPLMMYTNPNYRGPGNETISPYNWDTAFKKRDDGSLENLDLFTQYGSAPLIEVSLNVNLGGYSSSWTSTSPSSTDPGYGIYYDLGYLKDGAWPDEIWLDGGVIDYSDNIDLWRWSGAFKLTDPEVIAAYTINDQVKDAGPVATAGLRSYPGIASSNAWGNSAFVEALNFGLPVLYEQWYSGAGVNPPVLVTLPLLGAESVTSVGNTERYVTPFVDGMTLDTVWETGLPIAQEFNITGLTTHRLLPGPLIPHPTFGDEGLPLLIWRSIVCTNSTDPAITVGIRPNYDALIETVLPPDYNRIFGKPWISFNTPKKLSPLTKYKWVDETGLKFGTGFLNEKPSNYDVYEVIEPESFQLEFEVTGKFYRQFPSEQSLLELLRNGTVDIIQTIDTYLFKPWFDLNYPPVMIDDVLVDRTFLPDEVKIKFKIDVIIDHSKTRDLVLNGMKPI